MWTHVWTCYAHYETTAKCFALALMECLAPKLFWSVSNFEAAATIAIGQGLKSSIVDVTIVHVKPHSKQKSKTYR